jgi:hypothetical protein
MCRAIAFGIFLVAAAPRAAAAQDQPQTPVQAAPQPSVAPPLTPMTSGPELPPFRPVSPPSAGPVDMLPPAHRPGSSCATHADCDPLRCLRHVCVDEETFIAQRAESAPRRDDGVRYYLGGALGGVLPGLIDSQLGEGFQGALRGGILVNHFQFQLDVSPGTTALFNVANQVVAAFEATGSAAYLAPLSERVSWIFRIGGGGGALFAGGTNGAVSFGELRADVFGVAVRSSDHVMVELNAPSYRLLFPSGGSISMLWVTSLGIDYLF